MAGETLCLALYRHCRRCNCSVSFGCLAQYEANQFVNNFATLGNQFKRVVTDWGRLAAVGGPIARGQLVWDPTATSVFLRAFDITTRRQFYPTLMRANPNYLIAYVKYGDVQYQGGMITTYITKVSIRPAVTHVISRNFGWLKTRAASILLTMTTKTCAVRHGGRSNATTSGRQWRSVPSSCVLVGHMGSRVGSRDKHPLSAQ